MADVTKGKTFTANETVTNTKLHQLVDDATVTEIVNADINAAAAIAFSKLAALTSAQILVGSSGNEVTAVAMSGDVAIDNVGATVVSDLTIAGEVQGDVIYFNGTNWVRLPPGTSGQLLKTLGAAANPLWALPSDLLMASQVQGTIIYFDGTNWVVLAPGTSGQLLKTLGAAADPAWGLASDLLMASQAQGTIIYFDGTNWVVLPPGTSGQVLKTQGAAANPLWSTLSSSSIQDADGDTKVDTEESGDEDIIRMSVAGVEAFHLSAVGILNTVKQSGVRASAGSAQVFTTGIEAKVQLSNVIYDIHNEFDETTNYRFTATEAGIYMVVGQITWEAFEADKTFVTTIKKNGTAIVQMQGDSSFSTNNPGYPTVGGVQLAANDYLELWGLQFATGNESLLASINRTYMSVNKIA